MEVVWRRVVDEQAGPFFDRVDEGFADLGWNGRAAKAATYGAFLLDVVFAYIS